MICHVQKHTRKEQKFNEEPNSKSEKANTNMSNLVLLYATL